MVAIIQVIGIIFGIVMIYISYLYFKRKDFSVPDLAVWILIWIGLVVAISFPTTLQFLLQPLSIYRVLDFLMVVAFGIIFIFIFVMYRIIRHVQKDTEKIVRKLALENEK